MLHDLMSRVVEMAVKEVAMSDRNRGRHKSLKHRGLQLESLENRELLTVSPGSTDDDGEENLADVQGSNLYSESIDDPSANLYQQAAAHESVSTLANEIVENQPTKLATPTDAKATATSTTAIKVTWECKDWQDVGSYTVYYTASTKTTDQFADPKFPARIATVSGSAYDNGMSVLLTGLKANTPYQIKIVANTTEKAKVATAGDNYKIASDASTTITARTAAKVAAVPALTITAHAKTNPVTNQITLNWGIKAGDNGYVIEYSKNSNFDDYKTITTGWVTNGTNKLKLDVPDLDNLTTYYFRIKAVGGTTNGVLYADSAFSAVKFATTVIGKITTPITVVDFKVDTFGTGKGLKVTWTPDATDGSPITGYVIEYCTVNTFKSGVISQTVEVLNNVEDSTNLYAFLGGLKADATYFVRVKGVGTGIETEWQTQANYKSAKAPAAADMTLLPVLNVAKNVKSNSITISWGAVANAQGYAYEVWDETNTTRLVDRTVTTKTSVTLTGSYVSPNTSYIFKVGATPKTGKGHETPEAFAASRTYTTAKTVLAKPAKLVVAPNVTLPVKVTDPVDYNGAVGLKITWEDPANVATKPNLGAKYVIEYSLDAKFVGVITTEKLSLNALGKGEYIINNLLPNTKYHVRIKAVGANGAESAWVVKANATTQKERLAAPEVTAIDNIVTNADGKTTDMKVTWSWAPKANTAAASFKVYYSTDSSFTAKQTKFVTVTYGSTKVTAGVPLTGVNPDGTFFTTLPKLTSGTTYYIRIEAVAAAGFANSALIGVAGKEVKLAAMPQGVTATTGATGNAATVAWSMDKTFAAKNVKEFQLWYSTETKFTNEQVAAYVTVPVSDTYTYTLNGLQQGKKYYFRVTAVMNDGSMYGGSAQKVHSLVANVTTAKTPAVALDGVTIVEATTNLKVGDILTANCGLATGVTFRWYYEGTNTTVGNYLNYVIQEKDVTENKKLCVEALQLLPIRKTANATTVGTVKDVLLDSVTISGKPIVGETLTAKPNAGASNVTYQWQHKVIGTWTDISGANKATYTVASEDVGYEIRVIATQAETPTPSLPTDAVTFQVLSVRIEAVNPFNEAPATGKEIKTSLKPDGASSAIGNVAYKWYYGTDPNGTTWTQCTGTGNATADYIPDSNDADKYLKVVVTGISASGYTGEASRIFAQKVAQQGSELKDISVDTERPVFEEKITVTTDPTDAQDKVTYTWSWANSKDDITWNVIADTPIDGTYTPKSTDGVAGKFLRVVVKGANGYYGEKEHIFDKAVVAQSVEIENGNTPTVGTPLTTRVYGFGTDVVDYQWYVEDAAELSGWKVIDDATSSTYTPDLIYVDKILKVVATSKTDTSKTAEEETTREVWNQTPDATPAATTAAEKIKVTFNSVGVISYYKVMLTPTGGGNVVTEYITWDGTAGDVNLTGNYVSTGNPYSVTVQQWSNTDDGGHALSVPTDSVSVIVLKVAPSITTAAASTASVAVDLAFVSAKYLITVYSDVSGSQGIELGTFTMTAANTSVTVGKYYNGTSDINLSVNTPYWFTITEIDGSDKPISLESAAMEATTLKQLDKPMLDPDDITVIGLDTVTFMFDAVTYEDGIETVLDTYIIQYRAKGTSGWITPDSENVNIKVDDDGVVTVELSGLGSGITYEIRVIADAKAITGYVNSEPSNIMEVATRIVAPEVTLDAAATTSLTFTWTWDTVTDATGYKVWYRIKGDAEWMEFGSGVTTQQEAVLTGLEFGEVYEIRVQGIRGASVSYYGYATGRTLQNTPDQLDRPEVNLVSGSTTKNSLTFTWDAVERATGYKVEYRTYDAQGEPAAEWIPTTYSGTTTLTAALTGLGSYQKYEVRVKALSDDEKNNSAWSDIAAGTTLKADIPVIQSAVYDADDIALTITFPPTAGANVADGDEVLVKFYNASGERIKTTVGAVTNAGGTLVVVIDGALVSGAAKVTVAVTTYGKASEESAKVNVLTAAPVITLPRQVYEAPTDSFKLEITVKDGAGKYLVQVYDSTGTNKVGTATLATAVSGVLTLIYNGTLTADTAYKVTVTEVDDDNEAVTLESLKANFTTLKDFTVTVSTKAPGLNSKIIVTTHPVDATVSYLWEHKASGGSWAIISKTPTDGTYIPNIADLAVGDELRVTVTGTGNYAGKNTHTWIKTVAAYSVSIISDGDLKKPKVGDTLTADIPGFDEDKVSFEWYTSTDDTNWTAIPGAIFDTYTLAAADVGCYIRVVVMEGEKEADAQINYTVLSDTNPEIAGTPQQLPNGKLEITVTDGAGKRFSVQVYDGTSKVGTAVVVTAVGGVLTVTYAGLNPSTAYTVTVTEVNASGTPITLESVEASFMTLKAAVTVSGAKQNPADGVVTINLAGGYTTSNGWFSVKIGSLAAATYQASSGVITIPAAAYTVGTFTITEVTSSTDTTPLSLEGTGSFLALTAAPVITDKSAVYDGSDLKFTVDTTGNYVVTIGGKTVEVTVQISTTVTVTAEQLTAAGVTIIVGTTPVSVYKGTVAMPTSRQSTQVVILAPYPVLDATTPFESTAANKLTVKFAAVPATGTFYKVELTSGGTTIEAFITATAGDASYTIDIATAGTYSVTVTQWSTADSTGHALSVTTPTKSGVVVLDVKPAASVAGYTNKLTVTFADVVPSTTFYRIVLTDSNGTFTRYLAGDGTTNIDVPAPAATYTKVEVTLWSSDASTGHALSETKELTGSYTVSLKASAPSVDKIVAGDGAGQVVVTFDAPSKGYYKATFTDPETDPDKKKPSEEKYFEIDADTYTINGVKPGTWNVTITEWSKIPEGTDVYAYALSPATEEFEDVTVKEQLETPTNLTAIKVTDAAESVTLTWTEQDDASNVKEYLFTFYEVGTGNKITRTVRRPAEGIGQYTFTDDDPEGGIPGAKRYTVTIQAIPKNTTTYTPSLESDQTPAVVVLAVEPDCTLSATTTTVHLDFTSSVSNSTYYKVEFTPEGGGASIVEYVTGNGSQRLSLYSIAANKYDVKVTQWSSGAVINNTGYALSVAMTGKVETTTN